MKIHTWLLHYLRQLNACFFLLLVVTSFSLSLSLNFSLSVCLLVICNRRKEICFLSRVWSNFRLSCCFEIFDLATDKNSFIIIELEVMSYSHSYFSSLYAAHSFYARKVRISRWGRYKKIRMTIIISIDKSITMKIHVDILFFLPSDRVPFVLAFIFIN
jgi:hypothetical protein